MAIQELPKNVQSLIRSSISVPSVSQAVIELVLNSIDAGATSVAVYVDLKYFKIRVEDDGCGMTQDQLELICGRYMTSKCYSVEDLKDGLRFFGFRGEALASIRDASGVLSIITKHATSKQAYSKMFVRGISLKISPCTLKNMDAGTTVIVQDFMYNLPVRQKCTHDTLDVEEIKRQIECIALMHPQISFSLHDECKGCTILQKHRSADLQSCFSHLFGMTVGQTLAPVQYKADNLTIHGYIGKESSKYKNLQFVYVNKRVVLNTKIHQLVNNILAKSSILRANGPWRYKPIPKEMSSKSLLSMPNLNRRNRFGVYVLNLQCPYAEYDICFDPKKTVIEFRNWKHILNCFEECMRQFLEKENLIDSSLVEGTEVPGTSPLTFLETIEKETFQNQSTEPSSDEEPFTLHIKRAFHGVPARRGGILEVDKITFNYEETSHRTSNKPKCTDKYITNEVAVGDTSAYSCTKFLKKQETSFAETSTTYKQLSCDTPVSSTDVFLTSNTMDQKLCKNSEVPTSMSVLSESDAVTPFSSNVSDVFTLQQKSCGNLGIDKPQKEFYPFCGKEITVSEDSRNLVSSSSLKEHQDMSFETHNDHQDMSFEMHNDQAYNHCVQTGSQKFTTRMTADKFVQSGNNVFKQKLHVSSLLANCKSLPSECNETQGSSQKLNHQSSREQTYFSTDSSGSDQKQYFLPNAQVSKNNHERRKESGKHSSFMNAEEFVQTCDKELSQELHEQDQIYPSVHKTNQYEHISAEDPARNSTAFNNEDCKITQDIQLAHLKEVTFEECTQKKKHQISAAESLSINDIFCVTEGDFATKDFIRSPYFTNGKGFSDNEMKVASPDSDVNNYSTCEENMMANGESCHKECDAGGHFNDFVKVNRNRKRVSRDGRDAPSEKQRLLEMTKVTHVINSNVYFDQSYNENLLNEDRESAGEEEKKFFCHYSPQEGLSHSVVNEKLRETEIPQEVYSSQMTNSEEQSEDTSKSPFWLQLFDSSGRAFYVHSDSGVTSYSAPAIENINMKYTIEGRYSFLPKGLSPGVQKTVLHNKSDLKPGTRQELHKMLLNDVSSTNESAEAKWRNAVGSESAESKKLVKKLLLDAESRMKHSRKPNESLYEKKLAKLSAKVSQIMYPTEYKKNIFCNMHVVGQCDKKFIIVYCSFVEDKAPHVIGAFDQHAVHERIRLETLMKEYMEEDRKHTFKATELKSEIVLPLNSKDCRIVKNFEEEFRRLGMSYEVLNDNCVSVKKVPTCLYNREIRENSRKSSSIERFLKCLISDHAEVLFETHGTCFGIPGVLQEIINYEACRGAIKFGEELALEECKTLIKNLAKCDQPFMCAHGRPTFGVIFDLEQINKTVKVAVNKLGLKT
ncbi:DNA mismatch repair protein Mlh3-like isoform X1 [Schistocerca americana]|uniref:DNA mismatch repair protein Mlh3-like isoform X1 n=1 Tax=Schistocerca americana TaxID=7009 RepID=UPI001F4F6093|nr:DNA mismatch repair protein Mlh3-like isoform X1 [Schistocerca americana]